MNGKTFNLPRTKKQKNFYVYLYFYQDKIYFKASRDIILTFDETELDKLQTVYVWLEYLHVQPNFLISEDNPIRKNNEVMTSRFRKFVNREISRVKMGKKSLHGVALTIPVITNMIKQPQYYPELETNLILSAFIRIVRTKIVKLFA